MTDDEVMREIIRILDGLLVELRSTPDKRARAGALDPERRTVAHRHPESGGQILIDRPT